jgi:glutamate racemase
MIGVFDSGVGGLTVLKSLLHHSPEYDYLYLGDNARAPYGNKSRDEVYAYTIQAVDFLFKKGCRLVIVACNTASALALRRLQQKWLPTAYPDRRVLGVVRPMAEAMAKLKLDRIGVIGTAATVKSGIYRLELKEKNPQIKIISKSAPLLVPLIESGWQKEEETLKILKKYLAPFKKGKIKALVLGCTHYPFIKKEICQEMGKGCKVYDSGEVVAKSLENYLKRHPELGIKASKSPTVEFFTTGDIDKFKVLGEEFLGVKMAKVNKIEF